jgi:hypothetical protein
VMFYPYNLTADRYETTLATNHLGLYVMVNWCYMHFKEHNTEFIKVQLIFYLKAEMCPILSSSNSLYVF